MKTLLPKFLKITISLVLILASFSASYAACDNPAFIEGSDRTYQVGDIISRNGKDYKVIVASWANSSASDFAYAPGTGSAWSAAWALESDPCKDTGINVGTCSDGIQNQDETGIDCGGTKCSPCPTLETCSDGIKNQDETGIDCGGSKCPACSTGGGGGGGGGSSSCAATKDDGLAEATFYYLLENGSSTTVTCSFDAVNDIKGTFYGALETARLHGSQAKSDPAKYCGMCASVTGPAGTATVHIADECPDCKDKNTGDTDIDLSPQAFAAIVGSESIGRASITWEEVSCPWTSPIHIIVQGSNQWYCKVIVGKVQVLQRLVTSMKFLKPSESLIFTENK